MKHMRLIYCEDFDSILLMDMNNAMAPVEQISLSNDIDGWTESISLTSKDFVDDMLFDSEHILDEWTEEV